MSDFIEFVANNANDKVIGNNFLQILNDKTTTQSALQSWFKDQGYDISLQECNELLEKKDNIINHLNQVKGY